MGLELASLVRDGVFRGEGVTDGRGQPVLLIPGFMAGDESLRMMGRWLKGTGHHPGRAGIRAGPVRAVAVPVPRRSCQRMMRTGLSRVRGGLSP